ncbi:MAG TPA: DUF1330 domain-containing protein, partial [Halothiobacillus sp.]|jgi:uncharacterized protein (DUF1330 family)|nr:DUF1330 domain-containing protein [Halothiobacillus sp.]
MNKDGYSAVKAYLVLDFKITDLHAFMEYVDKIPAFINKHNGKYLVEGVRPEVIEGEWQPETLVVLEFETRENANNFLSDAEVKALFTIRHKNTQGNLILVNGGSWRDAEYSNA